MTTDAAVLAELQTLSQVVKTHRRVNIARLHECLDAMPEPPDEIIARIDQVVSKHADDLAHGHVPIKDIERALDERYTWPEIVLLTFAFGGAALTAIRIITAFIR